MEVARETTIAIGRCVGDTPRLSRARAGQLQTCSGAAVFGFRAVMIMLVTDATKKI